MITINSSRTVISIESDLLDLFVTNPASYTSVTVKIYKDSTTSSTDEVYTNASPITTLTNVATDGTNETILPSFLSLTEFGQGVYYITVNLLSSTTSSTEEHCLYVDNGLKCKVDSLLMDETKFVQERVLQGLKYQSLASSIECPCKCGQKIELYLNLIDSIDNNCTTC